MRYRAAAMNATLSPEPSRWVASWYEPLIRGTKEDRERPGRNGGANNVGRPEDQSPPGADSRILGRCDDRPRQVHDERWKTERQEGGRDIQLPELPLRRQAGEQHALVAQKPEKADSPECTGEPAPLPGRCPHYGSVEPAARDVRPHPSIARASLRRRTPRTYRQEARTVAPRPRGENTCWLPHQKADSHERREPPGEWRHSWRNRCSTRATIFDAPAPGHAHPPPDTCRAVIAGRQRRGRCPAAGPVPRIVPRAGTPLRPGGGHVDRRAVGGDARGADEPLVAGPIRGARVLEERLRRARLRRQGQGADARRGRIRISGTSPATTARCASSTRSSAITSTAPISAVDDSHAHMNMPATLMWARGFDMRPVRDHVPAAGRTTPGSRRRSCFRPTTRGPSPRRTCST